MGYQAEFCRSRSNHVDLGKGRLKNRSAGARTLIEERSWCLQTSSLLHMGYRAKFGPSKFKSMGVYRNLENLVEIWLRPLELGRR